MSEARERKSYRLMCSTSLVLYLLGYGPAIYFLDRVPPAISDLMKSIYKPIMFLHLIPGMDYAITVYEVWWMGLAEKH